MLEDDSSVRDVLCGLLREEGYEVISGSDGTEGLSILKEESFDVIISDIKMPRMDGIEFLKQSRALRPRTHVILLTGYPDNDLAIEGLSEGAFDFIYKPFRMEWLLQVLENALRETQQEDFSVQGSSGARAEKQIRYTLGRKLRELSALQSLGEEIRTLTGFSGTGGRIVKLLSQVFGCRAVALFLKARKDGALRLASTYGFAREERQLRSMLLKFAGWILESVEAAAILDFADLPHRMGESVLALTPALSPPYLTAQLRVDGVLNGVILLAGRDPADGFSEEDKDLIAIFAHQIAAYIEKERLFEAVQEENRRNQAELEMAQKVQQGILPTRVPQRRGIRMAIHCNPARKIGGDFFGFIETYDSTLRLFVGDVAGKGVPAALIMAMAINVIKEHGKRHRLPEKILYEANSSLRGYLGADSIHYYTAFFAILDLAKGELRYAKAGHEKPLFYRASEKTFEWLDAPGHVLGLVEDVSYESSIVRVGNGDRLILYTDGVVEAVNENRECFGIERLQRSLAECVELPPNLIKEHLIKTLENWTQGAEQWDDLTFLIMEIGYEGWQERTISSDSDNANRVKAEIYEYLRTLEIPDVLFEDLAFCIKESFSNAMEHGNRGDSTKRLFVSWVADESDFKLKIRDEGEGFDPGSVPDPLLPENASKIRGRGIFMLRSFLDRVEWNEQGTEITILKSLPLP